jgi:hypothetical protein
MGGASVSTAGREVSLQRPRSRCVFGGRELAGFEVRGSVPGKRPDR